VPGGSREPEDRHHAENRRHQHGLEDDIAPERNQRRPGADTRRREPATPDQKIPRGQRDERREQPELQE
jgi:hypothetical protein